MKTKHREVASKLESLTDLVTNLKEALQGEKANSQLVLDQFKRSERDRKDLLRQKEDLEAEVASRLKSESILAERIRNLEDLEKELAARMKSESDLSQKVRGLNADLKNLEAKREELDELNARMMETESEHNAEVSELMSQMNEDKRRYADLHERLTSMDTHTKSLQDEFKRTLHKKEEESSKLRVVLQEAKGKLTRLYDENEELKSGNNESLQSMQHMLNDAIRSRANTDASLQESLQLLEQQKRIDIKRKGEIAKLEQTVEILKSKERYLESYVASLKKQIRRG